MYNTVFTGLFKTDKTFFEGLLSFESDAFIKLGFIALAVILFLLLIATLFKKKKGKDKHLENKGELLTTKELRKHQNKQNNNMFVIKSPLRKRKFNKVKQTLQLSKNVKMIPSKIFEHIAVFGPTGTGKSSTILIPQLKSESFDDISGIVIDPKSELYHKTKGDLKNKEFIVKHLDFTGKNDTDDVIGIDILQNCKKPNDVYQLCKGILANTEDKTWQDLSSSLLLAFAIRAYLRGKPFSYVSDEINEAPMDMDVLESNYFNSEMVDKYGRNYEMAIKAFNKFKKNAGSDGLLSSVLATINAAIEVFDNPLYQEVESKENFDFSSLRYEKTVVFISYPEHLSKLFAYFLSPFFSQTIEKIKEEFDEQEEDEYLPIAFLIDEFANIGKIPDVDIHLSTVRSKKMSFSIFIQSIKQIENLYGENAAAIILENTKTKLILDSLQDKSAEQVAQYFGERDIQVKNSSVGSDGKASYSYNIQTKKVLSAHKIRTLNSYEILIVSANLYPAKDTRNFYYLSNFELAGNKALGKLGFGDDTKKKFQKINKKTLKL